MNRFLHLVFLFLSVNFISVFADEGEEGEHAFEVAMAFDIAEAATLTWTNSLLEEEEGDEHGHDRRMLNEDDEGGHEDEIRVVAALFPGACTADSIEDSEEEAEELLESNTTFTVVEAFETINISSAQGLITFELHAAENTFSSLYFLYVNEPGCMVLFSEHLVPDGFLRAADGDELLPRFIEFSDAKSSYINVAVWVETLAAVTLTALASISAVVFIACKMDVEAMAKNQGDVLSLALGVLLGVIFLHLLPEANEFYGELDWQFGVVFLATMMVALLIKFKFGSDQEVSTVSILEKKDLEAENDDAVSAKPQKTDATMNIVWGDGFHNFSDGIIIATAFGLCGNSALGWLVTVSILCHEIPTEIADFVIIYNELGSIRKALCFNLCSSLSAYIGAIAVLAAGAINERTQGFLLAISMSTLLFIALAEVTPRVTTSSETSVIIKRAILIILGFVAIGLFELAPHEHCEADGSGVHSHE